MKEAKQSKTLTKETAAKIIVKLATGKPADEEVLLFTVGREKLLKYFEEKLREIQLRRRQ